MSTYIIAFTYLHPHTVTPALNIYSEITEQDKNSFVRRVSLYSWYSSVWLDWILANKKSVVFIFRQQDRCTESKPVTLEIIRTVILPHMAILFSDLHLLSSEPTLINPIRTFSGYANVSLDFILFFYQYAVFSLLFCPVLWGRKTLLKQIRYSRNQFLLSEQAEGTTMSIHAGLQ